MLVRHFTVRARDAGVAEDVVQELYLRVAAHDPTTAVDNPTAFLFTAATNIWLNRMRGEGRDRARSGQWVAAHRQSVCGEDIDLDADAESVVSARQQADLIRSGVEALPERTREIFRLHRYEGLNQAAVAARLGVSKSTVEKHLYSATRFLMARIYPEQGP